MNALNLLLVGLAALSICDARASPNRAESLTRVVKVGDKDYFSNDDLRMWKQAGELCFDNGMTLAIINSTQELEAIKQVSLDDEAFKGLYWTDARDSFLHRQFSWNSTEKEVPPLSAYPLTVLRFYDGYRTALVYNADPNRFGGFFPRPIDTTAKTLCQNITTVTP